MPATPAKQWIVDLARKGGVVASIGQVDPPTKRELEKLVAKGELAKWRGHWHPVAGAPWGIGPLKTCYGLPSVRDYFLEGVA